MGGKYPPSIPLVEPSDQRLKLARLAAAAAARVHHADPSGERLVVGAEHVSFVAGFLSRAYAARGMAYDEYSAAQRRGESLTPDEVREVRADIATWTNGTEAIEFLRVAQTFRKVDLIDGVGWDETEAKTRLRFLQGRRLIRPTRTGYYKAPAFIALLRDLVAEGGAAAERLPFDDEDAPF